MKTLILILVCFFFIVVAQEKNKQVADEKSGKFMLLGICDRTAFSDTNYSWWYNSEYDNYLPVPESLEKIKNKLDGVELIIVMGSWCSDSRREVPRLFKILDAVSFNQSKMKLICVDRNKKSPEIDIEKLDIKLVPTFILSRDNKELGRIIETPKDKLEDDILKILTEL